MDAGYVSALFGLGGALVGALASFSTSWLTMRTQLGEKRREAARTLRHELFRAFIAESSRLYADALGHEKDEITELVPLYALIANIRLVSSPAVVAAADKVLQVIGDAYLAPNLSLKELRSLAREGGMDFLADFSKACRQELDFGPV